MNRTHSVFSLMLFGAFGSVLTLGLLLVAVGMALPAEVSAAGTTVPVDTGAVSGMVFFDANGDGLVASDASEPGIPSVTIQLLGSSLNFTTTADAGGAYSFTGLVAGNYTVVELIPAGYVTTTASSVPVTVGSGPVEDVNFGIAYPIAVTGVVCQDINPADGRCGLAGSEPRISGASVRVFDDANRNQLIDIGEAVLGATTTNVQGVYLIPNLRPGALIVVIGLPGGAESSATPLSLDSSEAGATTWTQNFAIARGSVQGIVFTDLNGNEVLESGEAPLAGAVVQALAAAGGQAVSPISVVATATTGSDGKFIFADLLAATYQLQVQPASLPAGWLASQDPTTMLVTVQGGVTQTLNLGFFDPLSAPPMSLADWKRELRQSGKWAYTAAELQNFIAASESGSRIFSETVSLRNALLMGQPANISTDQWRARKELAALWLNISSLRLRPETLVRLGALSTATTVRQARDQVEALLLTTGADNAAQALQIAQLLNTGRGVGIGLQGTSAVCDAIYGKTQVAPDLRPGGAVVTMKLSGGQLSLHRWNPGVFKTATNTLMAQVRIRVKSFNEGGVVDVVQVFKDGRQLTLGTAQHTVYNRDVNALYVFNLSRITTMAELVNTNVYLVVRDINAGKAAFVKVDSAEIIFRY